MISAALRAAWSTQAIPPTLEALAGIATGVADDEPSRALELSALVQAHPAATQATRDQAAYVLARLAQPSDGSRTGAQLLRESLSLDAIVAAILET